MSFVYAIVIGLVIGFADLSITVSLVLILLLVSFRSMKDILFKKDFITGTTSPYQLYLMNLNTANKKENNPAIRYYLQSLLFDGAISVVLFFVIRFLQ